MKGGKKGDPKYVPSSSDIATIMQLSPPLPCFPLSKPHKLRLKNLFASFITLLHSEHMECVPKIAAS